MRKLLGTFIIGVFVASASALAADPIVTDVLHARGEIIPQQVARGGQAQLRIHLDLARGHHAYLERFKIKVLEADFFSINSYTIEPTVEFFDKVSKSQKRGVQGQADLTALIEVSEKAPVGEAHPPMTLTYQACTDEYCLLPQTISVTATLTVMGGAESAPPSPPPPTDRLGAAFQKGLVYTFAFVFLMGILTSLTPCIYPMIPITLAVIGSHSHGTSATRGFLLSFVYVLGIALTYALMGVVVAQTGALFGSLMTSPWTVSVIAILFFLMALSMYGLFEIQPPAFVRSLIGAQKTHAGVAGAFATGLVAGVLASPCVGPVLVAILAYIAKTQNAVLGFSLLFTFALGMGSLLIAVGTFGHLLHRLPRSGAWMEVVKFVFGTLMMGAALYYLAQVAPRGLIHALTGVTCVALASLYGAFEANTQLTVLTRLRKGVMLAILGVGVALILAALNQIVPLWPAPGSAPVSQAESVGLKWEPFSEARLQSARGRPVIIDFGAQWCAACGELEEKTYRDTQVRQLGGQFILLKVDATESTQQIDGVIKAYGIQGLPTVLFLNPQGQTLANLTLTGYEDASAFLARMKQALE